MRHTTRLAAALVIALVGLVTFSAYTADFDNWFGRLGVLDTLYVKTIQLGGDPATGVAGTTLTATGAELNILDNVTATAAELNYLDLTTLGTGAANKAVVLDAGDDYTWPAAGILTYGVLKDPAGTTLTSTAAELNILDTVTATASELNVLDGIPASLTFAAAAAGANVCEVTVTVKDAAGATLAGVYNFDLWLSDAATGAGLTGTEASGTVTVKSASGEVLGTLTAKKALRVQTLATGIFTLEITDSAKTTFYVCAQVPGRGNTNVSTILATGDYGA